MINFPCLCGNTLYFENTNCVKCRRKLGFDPASMLLSPLEPGANAEFNALQVPGNPAFRLCANYSTYGVCNWLVPAQEARPYCFSCRFISVIPNLELPGNVEKWARIAVAQRRLFFTLLRLGLPLRAKADDPDAGLDFCFLADTSDDIHPKPIYTGHKDGVITLNIIEADDAAREQVRLAMHEPYRTLLGHLRHEIGHYYWRRLVANTERLPAFTALFGDASVDYAAALKTYHEKGPTADWSERFVSAYASSHPWEDWAETWAHYLHIYDTLETAQDLVQKSSGRSQAPVDFDEMMRDWSSLSIGLNCLNRSLGLRDAYPFVLAKPVIDKLGLIHDLIHSL
jgi:hypothetical protein